MKMLQRKQGLAALIALFALALSSNAIAQDGLLLDESALATTTEVQVVDDSFATKTGKAKLTAEEQKILAERRAQMNKRHLQEVRLKEQKRIAAQLKAAVVTPVVVTKAKAKKRRLKKRKKRSRKRVARSKRRVKKDQVKVVQSASKKVVAKQPTKKGGILGGRNLKVIPFAGVANIKKGALDLSTKINTGLIVEGELSERFTVGLGFRYTSLDMQDNSAIVNNGFSIFNTGTTGREVEYTGLNIEANSKFFFTRRTSFIRPFVGIGVAWNKNSLNFSDAGQTAGQSLLTNNGLTADYGSTMITGSALIGAEANFNDTFGAYLAGRFTTGVSGGGSDVVATTSTDQQRLNEFGNLIDDATVLGVNAGIVLKF
jgi:hypothetical protein